MKKAIALLMALALFLPGLAGALGVETVVTCEADAALMRDYLALFGMAEASLDTWATGIASLLNDLRIQARVEEEAGADLIFRLGESDLATMCSDVASGVVQMSWLPGLSLLGGQGLAWPEITIEKWLDATEAAQNALMDIPHTERFGSFYGDAYSGGVHRRAWELDDMAAGQVLLAALDALNDAEASTDAPSLWDELKAWVMQRQMENINQWRYSQVLDAAGMMVGESLTMLVGQTQVLTCSIGYPEENLLRLVLGWGTESGIFYLDALVDSAEQDKISYSIALSQDFHGLGLSGAEETPLATVVGQWHRETENLFRHTMTVGQALGVVRADSTWLTTPLENGAQVLGTQWVYTGDAEKPCMVWTFTSTPAEVELLPLAEDAELLSMEDPHMAEKVMEAAQKGTTKLIVRLFKYLPAEWLTQLLFEIGD